MNALDAGDGIKIDTNELLVVGTEYTDFDARPVCHIGVRFKPRWCDQLRFYSCDETTATGCTGSNAGRVYFDGMNGDGGAKKYCCTLMRSWTAGDFDGADTWIRFGIGDRVIPGAWNGDRVGILCENAAQNFPAKIMEVEITLTLAEDATRVEWRMVK